MIVNLVFEGGVYLYVINHRPDGDAVEKFRFEEHNYTLCFEKSFKNDSNMRRLVSLYNILI